MMIDDGVGECASRPRRRLSRCGNAIHHSPLGSIVGITASGVTGTVRDHEPTLWDRSIASKG
eukprot:7264068-Karenia_brevis.AAC.1